MPDVRYERGDEVIIAQYDEQGIVPVTREAFESLLAMSHGWRAIEVNQEPPRLALDVKSDDARA